MKPHVLKQLCGMDALEGRGAGHSNRNNTRCSSRDDSNARRLVGRDRPRRILLNASRPLSLRITTWNAASVFYHDAARP